MVISVKDVACLARESFETRERTSEKDKIWVKKENAEQWVYDLVYRAHGYGEMLPDDYRYEFIVQALDALCEHDTVDDARDSISPDIYNQELLDWLGSRIDRHEIVDEAAKEYGTSYDGGIISLISQGMHCEMMEVFDQVYAAIHERLEAEISEEGDGHDDDNGGSDDV